MPRQANAVDFWRGFALVSIFVNHIPGIYYERLTHRNFSISDSAELFVFLAGWSLGYLVGSRDEPIGTGRLVARLGSRSLQIYAAQILISSIALALLAASAYLLENPLILEWHNASAVFQDPALAHIGLVLLTHQLGYFDILPLYVVLMLAAPGIAVIDRFAKPLLVPLSLSLYFASLTVPFTAPTWPVPGQWFFNPFTWQAIFVLGFSLSRNEGLGAFVRCHIRTIRIISLPVVLFAAAIVVFSWMPDPTKLPEPKLLFLNGKSFLTPMRLIQFLALAAVFSATYPLIARALPWLCPFLSILGRNSLYVFCVGSLLSLTGQLIRYLYSGSFAVDTIIFVVGIGLLWLTAWTSEWRERQKRADI
ncbi:MAG: OpgC domain-containing protein [Hyphomicrobiaceae bacterium]|nr:MAG: OpgC domain-containing protein [Hyphomicrobiaceae bacterium]